MLKSITTKNFKKLSDHHFDFTDDLNIISGDNAIGKTTLTQAMMFCLFGVKAVPGDAADIPTWGEKDCKVLMSFGKYEISRTLKNCTIHKNGELEATGNSVCSDYVEKNITGVDLKGFEILNWSAQGETGALLTIGAMQLQKDVEKFSGVQFIDEMLKLANKDMNDLKRDTKIFEPKGTEKELKHSIGKNESAYHFIGIDQAEMKANKIAIYDKKEGIEANLETAEETNRKSELGHNRLIAIVAELNSCTTSLKQLSDESAQLVATDESLNPIEREEYDAKKVALRAARKLNTEIAYSRESRADSREALVGIDEKIKADEKLRHVYDGAQITYDSAQSLAGDCNDARENLQERISSLESSIEKGVCETCGQSIMDDEQKADYENKLQIEKASEFDICEKAGTAETGLKAAKKDFDAAKADLNENHGKWAERKADFEKSEAEYEEYLSVNIYVEGLDEQETELETALANLTRHEELQTQYDKICRKITNTETELATLQGEQESLINSTPEKIAESVLQGYRESIRELVVDLSDHVEKIHTADIKLTEISTLLGQLKLDLKLELEFRAKLGEVKLLEEFTQYLKDARLKFLASVWANILSIASDFLNQATAGTITALIKSDKKGFMFCENGTYAPIKAASGAQKGFIGVAVRIALAKSLRSSCPILVLDEPTESMREENALRLSGALLGQGQVIMVTHRESDKLSASNVIQL